MEKHKDEEAVLRRNTFTHEQFNKKYKDEADPNNRKSVSSRIYGKFKCSKSCLMNGLLGFIPLVGVLRTYDIRQMLLPDILAGISVAVMHIPMGMGFGLLASLAPIHGLYTSFFPVVAYGFLGTSHHTSIGSNAVIAVMVSAIVEKQSDLMQFKLNDTTPVFQGYPFNATGGAIEVWQDSLSTNGLMDYKVSVAAASSLIVGAVLGLMGFLGLGILAVFFSDPLVSGFTFGASVHIALFQFTKMLGLHLKNRPGVFKFVLTIQDFFTNISDVNFAAVIMSSICAVALVVVKWANERFKSKLRYPIPIDFLVAALATLVSHFLNMSVRYELPVVNKVPSGLSGPKMPAVDVIPNIAGDSFVVAVLVFALSMSIAKLLAKQWKYSIDENQELIAYGASNILGAFFQCFPSCQAPPRGMMAASLNVKTTFSGLISASVVLIVILFLGRFLESLPICALAAMIVVSLSKLYANIFDVKRFWILNKSDFIIWTITASVTIFIDMDVGLYVGLGTSLIIVIFELRKSGGTIVGQTEKGGYFIDVKSSSTVQEIPGIKIFRFNAPIFFGNVEVFQTQLYELTVDPDVFNHKTEVTVEPAMDSADVNVILLNGDDERVSSSKTDQFPDASLVRDTKKTQEELSSKVSLGWHDSLIAPANHCIPISSIILDFSRVTYIDATALKVLELIVKSYDIVGINVVITDCSPEVYIRLRKLKYFQNQPETRFAYDVFSAMALLSHDSITSVVDIDS